jgi:DNA-binding NarL/FixJ family response regulator
MEQFSDEMLATNKLDDARSAAESGERIRLLLVDDHPIVRFGLATVLGLHNDMLVVGMAESGSAAFALLQSTPVDVVLLDLRMPDLSGIETLKRIREIAPKARTIILSSFEYDEEINSAVKAGAQGYIHKQAPVEEIVLAIRRVHRGKQSFPKRIARQLANNSLTAGLSARELEVLELVAKGLTNKEAARALMISQFTVRNHLKSICMKLDVGDRTEAIMTAIHSGIITVT